jgi:hypothetical protein
MDFRAKLLVRLDNKAESSILGGKSDKTNLLNILWEYNGILFPYTPIISQYGGSANYTEFQMTHSNYKQPVYTNSEVRPIAISAKFTAQNTKEAKYMLAVFKFLATVTKMNFGEREPAKSRGLPPPILLFSYMGQHMFNEVPVVVTSYGIDLPDTVDYVTVNDAAGLPSTQVPCETTVTIELMPYFNPYAVRRNFKLSDFSSGSLLSGNYNTKGYL